MMPRRRTVHVHPLPDLVPSNTLPGSTAVVIDVLRATTTIVHALAAGCTCVRPCLEIDDARRLAQQLPPGTVILAGERHTKPITGFDLGNSPDGFTPATCGGKAVILTTTNGTKAILRAADADRVLIAAFVNMSAVVKELTSDPRPINIICSGVNGEFAIEDTLLAGALVHALPHSTLNDSAKRAREAFEHHRRHLLESLRTSQGGAGLVSLGYDEDIQAAAQVDRFAVVPVLHRDPMRIASL